MWKDDLPRGIVGMHLSEDTGYVEDLSGVPWVKFLAIVDYEGRDFSAWSENGHGVVCRLRYGPWVDYGGTIPREVDYDEGAMRTAAFVAMSSTGCHIWEIGNEPNKDNERPDGEIITPDMYATYFVKVEELIHDLPGHELDWVVPAAVAPWNVDTKYEGNENGDWIAYYQDMLTLILEKGGRIDALQWHTYSHGDDPSLIKDLAKMNPPFEEYYYNFLAYTDFAAATPEPLIKIPVLITEINQDGQWHATGWILEAFREIDNWNKFDPEIQQLIFPVWAMFTFRYEDERYGMKLRPGVMAEFHETVRISYKRPEEDLPVLGYRTLYQTSFEEGFYYPLGEEEKEVDCPIGWRPAWNKGGPRPEFKPKSKEAGQPEVRTGMWAAGFFHVSSIWGGVLYKEFTVAPNAPVRLSAWCMGVHAGGPNAGMSVGIFHEPLFFADDTRWQEWWSPYMAEYKDREWRQLVAIGAADANGRVIVALFGRTDAAIEGWNTHFDDVLVEVYDDGGPIDPPVEPPEGGIMDSVTAIRAECDKIAAAVANPILCIRV